MKKKYPKEYDFCPNTYILPIDHYKFVNDQNNSTIPGQLWIYKPSNQGCGKGIKILNKQSKVKDDNNFVISEYIMYPHLIDGYKYDLRI